MSGAHCQESGTVKIKSLPIQPHKVFGLTNLLTISSLPSPVEAVRDLLDASDLFSLFRRFTAGSESFAPPRSNPASQRAAAASARLRIKRQLEGERSAGGQPRKPSDETEVPPVSSPAPSRETTPPRSPSPPPPSPPSSPSPPPPPAYQSNPPMATRMPIPTSRDAPKFDGVNPSALAPFFRVYSRLADEVGLAVGDKITRVTEYVAPEEEILWAACASFKTPTDWDAFTAEIFSLYPGSEDAHRYGIEDLNRLRDSTRSAPMTTLYQWGVFRREFQRVAGWLSNNMIIGELEQQRMFWDSLPEKFKEILMRRLSIKHPDHQRSRPFPISAVTEAANYELQATSTSPVEPERVPTPPVPTGQVRYPSNSVVKTEVFDRTSNIELQQYINQTIEQRMNQLQSGPSMAIPVIPGYPQNQYQARPPYGSQGLPQYIRPPLQHLFHVWYCRTYDRRLPRDVASSSGKKGGL